MGINHTSPLYFESILLYYFFPHPKPRLIYQLKLEYVDNVIFLRASDHLIWSSSILMILLIFYFHVICSCLYWGTRRNQKSRKEETRERRRTRNNGVRIVMYPNVTINAFETNDITSIFLSTRINAKKDIYLASILPTLNWKLYHNDQIH